MRAILIFVAALPLMGKVFPEPREMRATGAAFPLDEKVVLCGPPPLTGLLAAELSDRFGLAVRTVQKVAPGERAIVMRTTGKPRGPEGYTLEVTHGRIAIEGSDDAGTFYGLQTLRQLLTARSVPGVMVRDRAYKPFRGIKMYLPGRNNIPFFKRFVRDFMAVYKYNKLILELNAGMRFDRHPELNAGWMEFARDLNFSRRERPLGNHRESQDSSHQDTADGGVLEKPEVADLVRWAEQFHIEVIPEIPSLTHSYYLLTRHRELAENADVEWPDTYCPSQPAVYPLLFDVLDEYIEVMHPKTIHVGHDEWRVPWTCPRCSKRDFRELFAEDLNKIHKHLADKGVRTAIWGDHLIEPLRGRGLAPRTSPAGRKYVVPGGLTPEQVRKWIPKDILIFNWFWDEDHAKTGQGEKNDIALEEWGFQQVYGNMTPRIQNYAARSARKSVLGGAPSSWAATTEFNFGKDLIAQFLGCASLLWSAHPPDPAAEAAAIQEIMPAVRRAMTGEVPPSDTDPVTPVKIAGREWPMPVKTGRVQAGKLLFDVERPAMGGAVVAVGEDATSLVFLHAAEQPGVSAQAYRYIFNFPDTTDLIGWYEVVYEDGYVESVPVRYRVNALEWSRAGSCYQASTVDLSAAGAGPATFFAYEWINPRMGKVIREVRVKNAVHFIRTDGKPAPKNGIILAGLSVVKKRGYPDPVRAR